MKNGFIIFVWFVGCFASVIAGVITFYLNEQHTPPVLALTTDAEERLTQPNELLAELDSVQGIQTIVETEDARPEIVANFLRRYNSPMEPHDTYGQVFVEVADKYELDFRLLPAIAMNESGLCKAIPENSYNCFGYGIHSRGTLRFESYETAIDTVAKGLKKNYIDQGRTTPEQIMQKYTPSSPNGAWAKAVGQFMAEMRYDDRALGREKRDTSASVLEFAESDAPDQATPVELPSNP